VSQLHRFVVTDGGDLEQLINGLSQRANFVRDPDRRSERSVYDTFDWRLFEAGTFLELITALDGRGGRGEVALAWRSSLTGEVLGRLGVDEAPRFVWELPAGAVTDRLSDVIEMRALVPLVTLSTVRHPLRLVDDEGKTVVRVIVEDSALADGTPLAPVVEVHPVRGYEAAATAVVDLLAAQVLLGADADDVATMALRAVGLSPGSYNSKLRLRLDGEGTALDAYAEVLRTLLATMLVNERGVRDDLDSEFLHDFRVAVRRTRSVLGQARGVLPAAVLDCFRAEFAWLGTATSPTRDFDVYLLTLPEFEAGLPPARKGDLKPFGAFLDQHQRSAQRALVAELDSDRYRTFVDEWRAWLVEPASDAPDAASPAVEVASLRIWKAYRRLIRAGRRITDDSEPEALHDLRKDAKKLRYLLECFGSLFPADEIAPLVKQLKALQDVLGEFQDCEVQAGSLEGFGQQMLDEGGTPASSLIALGYLVEQLDERQGQARAAFADRFGRFDTKRLRRAARTLFGPMPVVADRDLTSSVQPLVVPPDPTRGHLPVKAALP